MNKESVFKILFVIDDQVDVDKVSTYFDDVDCDVIFEHDENKVFSLLQQHEITLMLLTNRNKDNRGYKIAEKMKSLEKIVYPPFIILTEF